MRKHEGPNHSALEALMEKEEFARISGFSKRAFAMWAPRLYDYQNGYLTTLIAHDQELRRNNPESPELRELEELRRIWPNTPWAATTFNFGPETTCFRHADYGNLAFGWCSVTALGEYDHTKGGHLILWDMRLVIQFPPGSTILIPSCAISHSNARIQKGENRYSFTQYSAGGIFRWVDNDFKKVEDGYAAMSPEEEKARREELAKQLTFGLTLYSTIDEIKSLVCSRSVS
ncbi:hypothetical protein GALMADRAFT_81821 [Galerina marginata CBS 339.88]|uniref:Uncharacterized protein n=1 Tax=Galerina marginata (strain CBS 339.88) TaxID=685588 RepID=A0A067SFF4_GALM3|nr:hypothetical protein GALMADRAFT_81821 [Galerina marginata CBS 339.88]